MKRIVLILLASAAAVAANTARAETHVRIGVNLGAPIYSTPAPAVVYAPEPAPVYVPAPVYSAPSVVYAPPTPRGYWKDVTVKTWVPERWVTSRDHWGRPVRVCEPGYYTYRTDRVWVENHWHDRDGRDNRGYSYNDNRGYYDNHGWNR